MENAVIKKWLEDNPDDGYGSGSGYGYGYGYGDGSGSGSGYGSGYGSGSGYGYGDGSGSGSGYGSGSGSGSGYCDGLKSINNNTIWYVDGLQTLITHIKGNIAKGFLVNEDLTLQPCYIAKGNGYFAHGKSVKETRESLIEKYLECMDEEDVIDKFLNEFEKDKSYKGTEFFKWHHYLTGSCLMGRESFVKNHNIDLDTEFTVDEFIELCENDYGSSVIKNLKEQWKNKR